MLDVDQMLRRSFRHRKFKTPFASRTHGFDGLQLIEHLDARLRLTGLRCFVAEALNEGRKVRGLPFIGFGSRILQAHFFNALRFVKGVVAAVALKLSVFNRPGGVGGPIQKLTVVADDDNGAVHAFKPRLKPDEAVHVKVVGGFVQKQEVCGAHQSARQSQAVSPAARKAFNQGRCVRGQKPQAPHNGQGLSAHGTFVDFRELCKRCGFPHRVTGLCGFFGFLFGSHERRVAA